MYFRSFVYGFLLTNRKQTASFVLLERIPRREYRTGGTLTMKKKSLLTHSTRVAMSLAAVNTEHTVEKPGMSYRSIGTALDLFEVFLEIPTRPKDPHLAEMVGYLHEIPKLFKTACENSLRAYRELTRALGKLSEHEMLDKEVWRDWQEYYEELQEDIRQKRKAHGKTSKEVVDLFDFLATLAEHDNVKTPLMWNLQPKAAHVFHRVMKEIYQPGKPDSYPFSDQRIAGIIIRYLGSPLFKNYPEKGSSNYILFRQVVYDLFETWGCWHDHPEIRPRLLRALHRTDQISMLLTSLRYDHIIPDFLKFAVEVDGMHMERFLDPAPYGEYDPKNPLVFLEMHKDKHFTGRMISNVLRLIKVCYRGPAGSW